MCVVLAGCSLLRRGQDEPVSVSGQQDSDSRQASDGVEAESAPHQEPCAGDESNGPARSEQQGRPAAVAWPRGTTVRANALCVNGEVITVQDILEPIYEILEDQAGELSAGQYREVLSGLIQTEIRDRVYRVLVYDRASVLLNEEQYAALDRVVDNIVRDRVNSEYGGSQSAFELYLERFGKTIEDVRQRERRRIIVQQYLRDQVVPRVHITRRTLLKYWRERHDEFVTKAQGQMYLIDVPGWAFLPGASGKVRISVGRKLWEQASEANRVEALAEARRQLERAAQELAEAGDFEGIAKKYSQGINASRGGNWGLVSLGELQGRWAVINDVLAGLEPGQTSPIVEGEDGFFLVKAGQKQEGRVVSFEQAQPEIERRLADEQSNRLITELLGRLRAEATISGRREQEAFVQAVVEAAPRAGGMTR